ncbi:hypothetical protein ACOSP7_004366 [Xanthoceras sorbifolium]
MFEPSVKLSTASILACVFIVNIAPPCLAAGPAPGLQPFFVIQGCVQDIITSLLSHQVRLIGPACCKALNEGDDKCFLWTQFSHHWATFVAPNSTVSGYILTKSFIYFVTQNWLKTIMSRI